VDTLQVIENYVTVVSYPVMDCIIFDCVTCDGWFK